MAPRDCCCADNTCIKHKTQIDLVYTSEQERCKSSWHTEASGLTSHAETSRNETTSPTKTARAVAAIVRRVILSGPVTLLYLGSDFGQEKAPSPPIWVPHVLVVLCGVTGRCPFQRRRIRFWIRTLHTGRERMYPRSPVRSGELRTNSFVFDCAALWLTFAHLARTSLADDSASRPHSWWQ